MHCGESKNSMRAKTMAVTSTKGGRSQRAVSAVFNLDCDELISRGVGALAGICLAFVLTAGIAHAGVVFVSATAAPGGDGSEKRPVQLAGGC